VDEETFKRRTRGLALATIAYVESLRPGRTSDVLGRQLLRSITSVGANYRASCRARSIEEIIAKLSIVEEEADESLYWLELTVASHCGDEAAARPLLQETSEILAMTVASKKTLKSRIGARGFAATADQSGARSRIGKS
jgi:four helix bundle protein